MGCTLTVMLSMALGSRISVLYELWGVGCGFLRFLLYFKHLVANQWGANGVQMGCKSLMTSGFLNDSAHLMGCKAKRVCKICTPLGMVALVARISAQPPA